jgi:selenocysteine lyase/cysteine desulfurase
VVLHDQFPSNVYSWRSLAAQKNAVVKTVPRPVDNDWTPALLESIEDNTAVVAVSNCHWTDGTLIDLEKIGEQCRLKGAALVIDGIQSLGALPFSVERVQPDFLVAGTHKWLLGPYSFGFCYVDSRWHDGMGLEENWMNRADSEDFSRLVDYRDNYQNGARRFDMGESSSFILSPIAAAALKQILDWGVENIALTLQGQNRCHRRSCKRNRTGCRTQEGPGTPFNRDFKTRRFSQRAAESAGTGKSICQCQRRVYSNCAALIYRRRRYRATFFSGIEYLRKAI